MKMVLSLCASLLTVTSAGASLPKQRNSSSADAGAVARNTEQPGELSCAAFPAPVSETWLIQRFGAANVVTDSIIGADDGPFPGTVVYPSTPGMRLDVAWQDPNTRTAAAWIRIQGDSRWVTSYGFGVGADLLSVERANGWPFRLHGLIGEGWFGGRLLSWGRGRFAAAQPEGACSEVINFQHSYDGSIDGSLLKQVNRIAEVSSGHPAMQQINPRVVAVWLSYSQF
jgi:hypothetical protein